MIKTEVVIEGMACGMCESHINDVIRKNFNVKKVSSSHKKKRTEIISESEISEEELHKAIDPTGYKVISVNNKPYEKKKYSFFGKK